MAKRGNKLPITRLKKLRSEFAKKCNQKEWTQEAVARKVGASVKSYRDWENGERIPDTCYLMKLAQLFYVSCDYLLEISDYTNVGNAEIFKLTGLSDTTTSRLRKANGDLMESLLLLPELNALLCSEEFWSILSDLSCYRIACQAIKSRPAMAKETAKKARLSKSEEEVENYRQAIERHKKDYNFSIKDKEVLLFGIQKRLFRIADKIEKEILNG